MKRSLYQSKTGETLLDVAFYYRKFLKTDLNFDHNQLLRYAIYKLHLQNSILGSTGILAWTLWEQGYVREAIDFLKQEAIKELEIDNYFNTDHAASDLAVMLAESGNFAEGLDSIERLFPDDECFEASVFYVIQGWCLNRLGKKGESLRSFIKAATFSQDHEEKELIESAIPHRIDTLYSSNYFGCYHEKIRKGV